MTRLHTEYVPGNTNALTLLVASTARQITSHMRSLYNPRLKIKWDRDPRGKVTFIRMKDNREFVFHSLS